MRKNCLVSIALALVCSLITVGRASAQTKPPARTAAEEKAAIEAQVENYRKAFESRDVDAIMANYAPGNQVFVFDAVPPRQYPNWDSYKKDWEALFAAFPGPIKDTISDLNITVVGPVAYSHRIESTEFTKKEGTKQRLVTRETDVYRRINGKWLVVHEHVSFPADVETGKADLSSKP
jgi:ketosteroid isomerase-like protein